MEVDDVLHYLLELDVEVVLLKVELINLPN